MIDFGSIIKLAGFVIKYSKEMFHSSVSFLFLLDSWCQYMYFGFFSLSFFCCLGVFYLTLWGYDIDIDHL